MSRPACRAVGSRAGNDDDVDDDDGSGSGSDDDDDYKIIKVEKDAGPERPRGRLRRLRRRRRTRRRANRSRFAGGISIEEESKKKKAKQKFAKLEKKGRVAMLVKGGKVKDVTNTDSDKEEKEVVFMTGVCVGRGLLKKGDLGPVEDGGKYDIFDDSDYSDSDSD